MQALSKSVNDSLTIEAGDSAYVVLNGVSIAVTHCNAKLLR